MTFEGIINVYKPRGITSFDVVSKLRRLFQIRRIGHCGTLDPFAEGVLPVCVGRAVLATAYMDSYDKRYRVGMVFGARTDTQDVTGQVVSSTPLSQETLRRMREDGYRDYYRYANEMTRCTQQIPPMYSAVKIDGKPLYRYARSGVQIDRKPRRVAIYEFNTLSIQSEDSLKVLAEIFCSKGTYIRTLCADLGDKMACGAYAESLVRTACGPFHIQDSIKIEQLEEIVKQSMASGECLFDLHPAIVPVEFALSHLPGIMVSKSHARCLIQGQRVRFEDALQGEGPFLLFDDASVFIGIVRLAEQPEEASCLREEDGSTIKAERIFIDVHQYR